MQSDGRSAASMSGRDVAAAARSAVPADGWFTLRVPVRFRDLDPMGHAHHTLPLIYLEEARAAFWRELQDDASLDAIDYVMAEITLRFHARIRFPSVVTVRTAVSDVGRKSFGMAFELRDDGGVLLSSGSAVQVAFDYSAGVSKPLDAPVRERLETWRAAYQENSSAMSAETVPIIPPST